MKANILGLAETSDLRHQYIVCKNWASMILRVHLKLFQENFYDKGKKVVYLILTLNFYYTAEWLKRLIPAQGSWVEIPQFQVW